MLPAYDFSNARKNPYTRSPREQITISLDVAVPNHFREMAARSGIPCQTLIRLCLSDCVENHRTISLPRNT